MMLQVFIDNCYCLLRDWSFIRSGWAGANGMGVIHFCAPENGGAALNGCTIIVQPFLRGHVFLRIPISIPHKRNNNEGVNNKSNIIYY